MRDAWKVLGLTAMLITSVSAGPQPPKPADRYFIPPSKIEIDLVDWEWMSMRLTGQFHIDVRYPISDKQEIIAHYQAKSKVDKWYTMVGDYEIRDINLLPR